MTLMEVMMMIVVLQLRANEDPEVRAARLVQLRDHNAQVNI